MKMQLCGILISIFCSSFSTLQETADKPASLVTNGGFEEGMGGYTGDVNSFKWDNENWQVTAPAAPAIKALGDKEVFFEGKKSGMLQNLDHWNQIALAYTQVIPLNKFSKWIGQELYLSGAIKTKDATFADIRIEGLDAKGKVVAKKSLIGNPLVGTFDWKTYKTNVVIPQGVSLLVVSCVMQGAGTAWFDDIQLIGVPLEDSKVAAPQIQDFREKLSQYIRAPEGSDERRARENLNAYSTASIDALVATLQKGFQYDKATPGATVEENFRPGGTAIKVSVSIPSTYDPTQAWPLVIDLASTKDTVRLWAQELKSKDLFIARVPLSGMDEKSNEILIGCLRELRKKYAIDPDRVSISGEKKSAEWALAAALTNRGEFASAIMILPDSFPLPIYAENVVDFPVYCLSLADQASSANSKLSFYQAQDAKMLVQQIPDIQSLPTMLRAEVVDWMRRTKREALPDTAKEAVFSRNNAGSFWVSVSDFANAQAGATNALARLQFSVKDNDIVLNAEGARRVQILIDPRRFSVKQPLNIRSTQRVLFQGPITPDFDLFLKDLRQRADYRRIVIDRKEVTL